MKKRQSHIAKNFSYKKADGIFDGAYLNGTVACKIIWGSFMVQTIFHVAPQNISFGWGK